MISVPSMVFCLLPRPDLRPVGPAELRTHYSAPSESFCRCEVAPGQSHLPNPDHATGKAACCHGFLLGEKTGNGAGPQGGYLDVSTHVGAHFGVLFEDFNRGRYSEDQYAPLGAEISTRPGETIKKATEETLAIWKNAVLSSRAMMRIGLVLTDTAASEDAFSIAAAYIRPRQLQMSKYALALVLFPQPPSPGQPLSAAHLAREADGGRAGQ